MPDSPPPIPDYTLLRPVGRGAYGEVWLARSVTGVYRAVKIVRRASFNEDRPYDREFAGIKRFEPVSVGQDSQVALLHVGRNDAAGFFYYVMELADDIETAVRRLHMMERRFAIVAKYGLAATLVTALAVGGFLWASAQVLRTKAHLQRAERAEADAVARLHEAKLNWVRANRLTDRPGQRFVSLAELARAAARTNSLDLRNEAIACLALPDLSPLKEWAKTPQWDYSFGFNRSFRLYWTNDANGNLTVRDTVTDVVQYQLPTQGARLATTRGSPDEHFLATSDRAGHARVWDLRTQTTCPLEFPAGAAVLTFTPSSHALVVRHNDGSLQFLSSSNGLEQNPIPGPAKVEWIRFNSTGEMFLAVVDGQVLIHRTADGQLVRTLNAPAGAAAGIRYAAWHPDGRRLALAWMTSAGLWDVETGRQLATFEGHEGMMTDLTFTGTGEWLATTSWDDTTRLWHTETHREVLRLQKSGNNICLSADGSRLAFDSWDNAQMQLYELALPSAVQQFTLPQQKGYADHFAAQAVFSPTGELVAAVDKEGIFLFQPPNPTPVAHLPAKAADRVQFQPDGRALLTSGSNGMLRWPMAWSADRTELRLGPPAVLEPTRGQLVELLLKAAPQKRAR